MKFHSTCRLERLSRRRSPVFSLFLTVVALLSLIAPVAAQNAPEPRREQLLNGFRIAIINRPGDADVLLRLRVHSGAAFDLAGKEGLMALLSDALFDAETREFVREDLNGRIEVSTGHDAIDITLAGRASDFERFIDIIRNGFLNTQLTPDVIGKLREARMKFVREVALSPETIADRAVAARLFNKYPYGRVVEGAPESLARIERADLMLMRERFLNPNNTTLVVIGGVEPRRVMSVLRQSFGGWTKSDRVIPSTFRQPETPDARTLIIDSPGAQGIEARLAVRGLARSDRDAPAAHALVALVRERWAAALPELKDGKHFVRHDARADSGIFVLGATLRTSASAAKALDAARKILADLSSTAPGAAEFENAKRAAVAALNDGTGANDALADDLLSEHTYKTKAVTRAEVARALNALAPADAQRVAARLFLHTPVASVAVGEATGLSAELAHAGGVEIFGAPQPPSPPAQTAPAQTQPPARLKRP